MDDDLSNVDMSTKIHSLWQLIEIDAQEKKKTHNAKNINKCNQCEHEFDNPCSLEIHLKNHILGKWHTTATSVTMHPLGQVI